MNGVCFCVCSCVYFVIFHFLLVAAKAAESNPRCVQISWEIRVEYLCFNEICPQIITMLQNPSCKGFHLRAFFCRFLELTLPSFRRLFSGNFPRPFWKTKSFLNDLLLSTRCRHFDRFRSENEEENQKKKKKFFGWWLLERPYKQ